MTQKYRSGEEKDSLKMYSRRRNTYDEPIFAKSFILQDRQGFEYASDIL